jgi:hypothetical protein
MAVFSKTYFGEPGNYYILDAEISNVTILKLTRSGIVHYPTGNESAVNLEYIYSAASGGIVFDQNNPFNGPTGGGRPNRRSLEVITVNYKA